MQKVFLSLLLAAGFAWFFILGALRFQADVLAPLARAFNLG